MNYEKIVDRGSYRIYKFSKPLSKGFSTGLFSGINQDLIYTWDDTKELCGKKAQEAEYFIVSDASTHIERIVFPMWFIEDKNESDLGKGVPCIYKGVACHGKYTMMIHGGDDSTIRPDEEYLNELWDINQ